MNISDINISDSLSDNLSDDSRTPRKEMEVLGLKRLLISRSIVLGKVGDLVLADYFSACKFHEIILEVAAYGRFHNGGSYASADEITKIDDMLGALHCKDYKSMDMVTKLFVLDAIKTAFGTTENEVPALKGLLPNQHALGRPSCRGDDSSGLPGEIYPVRKPPGGNGWKFAAIFVLAAAGFIGLIFSGSGGRPINDAAGIPTFSGQITPPTAYQIQSEPPVSAIIPESATTGYQQPAPESSNANEVKPAALSAAPTNNAKRQ